MTTRFGAVTNNTGEIGPRGFPGVGVEDITFNNTTENFVVTYTDTTTTDIPFPSSSLSNYVLISSLGNTLVNFAQILNATLTTPTIISPTITTPTISTITMTGDIIPSVNNVNKLGSATYYWNNAYLNTANINTLIATAVNSSLIPTTTNTISLGSATKKFNKLYTQCTTDDGVYVTVSNPSNGTVYFQVNTSNGAVYLNSLAGIINSNLITFGSSISPFTNYGNDLGITTNRWNKLYTNQIVDDGSTVSILKSGTGVTANFNVSAGISGTASSTNVSQIDQIIKGSGGGNITYRQQLSLVGGSYNMNYSGPSIYSFSNMIIPSTDNVYTLGSSSNRWSAVYAAGGVITTSDERMKDNIIDCDLGLDFVNDLKPRKYNWNNETITDVNYGLIAQELEQTLKDHNCPNFKGLHKPKDENDKYGINYSQLIPLLIKSVQQLSKKIEILENQIKINSK